MKIENIINHHQAFSVTPISQTLVLLCNLTSHSVFWLQSPPLSSIYVAA
jgi:hypothetical protein